MRTEWKDVGIAYKTCAKDFLRNYGRVIAAVCCLIIVVAGFLIAIGFTESADDYYPSREELIAGYKTLRAQKAEYLAICEGRIISGQPYDGSESVKTELRREIAKYDLYIATGTCEYDYLQTDDSVFDWFTPPTQKQAVAINNILLLGGFVCVAAAIVEGGKPRKTMDISANSAQTGSNLFSWTIIGVFFLTVAVTAFGLLIKSPIKSQLVAVGDGVVKESLAAMVFARLSFLFAATFFFYNLTALINNTVKPKWLKYIVIVIVLGAIADSYVFLDMLIDDRYLTVCALPVAGLLFNKTGFYNVVVAYQLPLSLVGGFVFRLLSCKKSISMEKAR